MKFFLAIICVIIAALALVQADNSCVVDGKTLKVGETYSQPGKCTQIKCEGPNSISAKTCPDVQSLKPCKYIPQDNTKSYPECCPRHEC